MKVTANVFLALDSGNLAISSLLHQSAAFETVDHNTFLQQLQTSMACDEVVHIILEWPHAVRSLTRDHLAANGSCRVPQESVTYYKLKKNKNLDPDQPKPNRHFLYQGLPKNFFKIHPKL